jgi:hypothetical protein
MGGLRSLLQAAALSNVPVDLQHRSGVSQHIADQHLATFDDHESAIAAGMRQVPFPTTIPFEVRINFGKAAGKTRLEQAMADTTERLLGRPAVEFLRSLIPEEYPAHGIADQDRIVRQVDELSLQADVLCLLRALTFGAPLCAHITNGPDGQWLVTQQHGSQTDIHRKLGAILVSSQQLESGAHRAHARSGEIVLSVSEMQGV